MAARDDDYPDVLPDDSRADVGIEVAALLANAVPVLGGVVSNVLSGWSAERKRERVREVLNDLALRIANLQSQVNHEYLRSDEFEDLLDNTLRRAAMERSDVKRRIYAAFLAGAITSPGDSYHEQLRFLRTLDLMQPDHVRVIRALLQEPMQIPLDPKKRGTIAQTLARRLPDMTGRVPIVVEVAARLPVIQ